MTHRFASFVMLIAILALSASLAGAAAVSTAFTYQGRIDRNGSPAADTYAMIFRLYDAASAGTQIGSDQVLSGVVATNGLFTVTLDFGAAAFAGQARWLDIQVKGSADGSYTLLTPRQPMTAAPYALYALNGGSGGSWVNNSGDLTYSGGGVGFLGASSPFASGKGVFIEGGNASYANIFGYNYDGLAPVNLALQAPGGNVGIGTTTPANARLQVEANVNRAIWAQLKGSQFTSGYNCAIAALGYTGTTISGAPAMGLYASSEDDRAVWGLSVRNLGVVGDCQVAGTGGMLGTPTEGVLGYTNNTSLPAGRFNCPTGGVALEANGIAKVKTLQILGGADVAERFESTDPAEPGTVMAIDPSSPGRVRIARGAYSHTVAGVVSGANHLAAGVELGTSDAPRGAVALALTGRVWVKCDATMAPIHAGDLVTTADRAGHAMAATDRARATGAILGKAMTSLEAGTGLVLVLVSLQ